MTDQPHVVNGRTHTGSSPQARAEHRAEHRAEARERAREAVAARDALAGALTRAGVQLPAMDVRTPWADDVGDQRDEGNEGDEGDEKPERGRAPLVELGVCAAPVALALAEVIERGAKR